MAERLRLHSHIGNTPAVTWETASLRAYQREGCIGVQVQVVRIKSGGLSPVRYSTRGGDYDYDATVPSRLLPPGHAAHCSQLSRQRTGPAYGAWLSSMTFGIPARRACSRRRLTRSSASSVTVGAWWSDRSRPASTARRHPSSSFQPSPTGMLSGFRSGRLLAAIQHGCRNGSLASCLRTATPRGAYRSARDERFTMVRGAANPAPRHP